MQTFWFLSSDLTLWDAMSGKMWIIYRGSQNASKTLRSVKTAVPAAPSHPGTVSRDVTHVALQISAYTAQKDLELRTRLSPNG